MTSIFNLFAAASAPVKLDVIRTGVTDLGTTTIPLATKIKSILSYYYHDRWAIKDILKKTYEDNQVKYQQVAMNALSQFEQRLRRSEVENLKNRVVNKLEE